MQEGSTTPSDKAGKGPQGHEEVLPGRTERADLSPEARVSTRSSAQDEGGADGGGGDGHTVVLQGLADFFGKTQVHSLFYSELHSLARSRSFSPSPCRSLARAPSLAV